MSGVDIFLHGKYNIAVYLTTTQKCRMSRDDLHCFTGTSPIRTALKVSIEAQHVVLQKITKVPFVKHYCEILFCCGFLCGRQIRRINI